MSEVDEEKTGKETSDSLVSEANEEGEKIGEEAPRDTSLMCEEDEEGSEGTGNATFDPLSALQSIFEEITLTLSGGKTTFSELIRQAENEMDERTHHDLEECCTHEQEKNGKSILLDDDAVEMSSTAEDLDTLKDDLEPMDSENKKETIPDSRSLVDVIIEMQGKENRNMEWYAKAEKRMEEEIKKMNLWGESRNTSAEMAEEKDIEEREKKGATELRKEWDTNKEAEQSAQLPKEREENGGINQLSKKQLERETDTELDRMGIICDNLNKTSQREDHLQTSNHLELQHAEMSRESQKESSGRLENLEYLSCAKEMSVSTNLVITVDLERKSTPFQISEKGAKEVHLNDEKMENSLEEEVFLVFGPYNLLRGDVSEHLKNGIVIQLTCFGYNVYEWIKNKISYILIKPAFLVYTNIKKDTLHQFHPETKWHGKTGIIRIDKRETERIEEFKCRKPKPISYLNLDVSEFLYKIKEEEVFSRVMFRIAIDSLTEEILTCFLNSVYAEQTLLFKQKLALMFQNESAADWFEHSVKTLCKGESPYMYCRWAGFNLLEQIINQRKTKMVRFCRAIPIQLPSYIEEINYLGPVQLKSDFLAKHLRLKEKIICNEALQ